MQKVLEHKTR